MIKWQKLSECFSLLKGKFQIKFIGKTACYTTGWLDGKEGKRCRVAILIILFQIKMINSNDIIFY